MQNFLGPVMLLTLSVVLLSSCAEEGEQQAVDQSYLDSETYQEFNRQSSRERSYRVDEATAFERVLKNFLLSPQTDRLNFPLEVDSVDIEKFTEASEGFELKQSMLNEPAEMNYVYYPVGKAEKEGLDLLFFVIRKQSMYNDKELAVATFNDTSLIAVQSLGEFNRTISQQVQSTVQIESSLTITSEIVRRTKYPVPQEYTTTYRYTIDSEGKIDEEIVAE